MLVRNFYASFAQFLFGTTAKVITTLTGDKVGAASLSQHYTPFFGNYNYGAKLDLIPTTPGNVGIYFGNGTTTSFEQTALPDNVYNTRSGFSASVTQIERSVTTESADVTAKYTITNNTDAEIVISSISACAGEGSSVLYLVDHTILDSPITIPAGGVGQVTYTISFPYPTA